MAIIIYKCFAFFHDTALVSAKSEKKSHKKIIFFSTRKQEKTNLRKKTEKNRKNTKK